MSFSEIPIPLIGRGLSLIDSAGIYSAHRFFGRVVSERRIVHFAATAHPTAEWTAQQLREAFPWESAPRYLLRDRVFGEDFVAQVKAMGIKQVLSAPRSPWQRAHVERRDRHDSPRVPRSHDHLHVASDRLLGPVPLAVDFRSKPIRSTSEPRVTVG